MLPSATIDTEGHDSEVMSGINWTKFRPKVLVVEYRAPADGDDASSAWQPLMDSIGYVEHARTENNAIYARG